jgi:nucleoside-diphosphate-sugar epimerase
MPVYAVYNLAAYGVRPTDRHLDRMIALNTVLPVRMVKLAAARRCPLVHAGSFSEYASDLETSHRLTESEPVETKRLYGSTKAAGSVLASAAAHASGTVLRVLRLFKVYGPGEEKHRLLPSLIEGLSARRRVPLSAGTQMRDFLHVDDAVDALLAAGAQARREGAAPVEILNACTGRRHSVRDFCEIAARMLDAPPDLLGFGDLPMRADDLPIQVGDPTRMIAVTGWQAKRDLVEGIQDAIRRSVQ